MGYITVLRENIENEMRIRGNFCKVQNILFLHKTDDNGDVYAVKGNNNRLLAVAVVKNESIEIFF